MEPIGPARILLFALLTAAATGPGALPFLFARHPSRRWLGVSNVAAGLMLAVSLGLTLEGWHTGPSGVLVGAGAGLIFVLLVRALLRQEEHPAVFAGLHGLDVRNGLLILVVMTAHSFTESVALGVSFGANLGLFIILAIAIHNVPEGLTISLVLVPRGRGREKGCPLERGTYRSLARCCPTGSGSRRG